MLAILCLAAFAILALAVSGLTQAAMPWLDRLARRLSLRHRVRFWFGVAALPSVVGMLAVAASFLPAMGVGHDHCLTYGSQFPHLCPHHAGAAPNSVLVAIAILLALRFGHVVGGLIRSIRSSRNASVALAEASDVYDGAYVFPSTEPKAFVLGALRPRVHLSRGLLALGPQIVEPVLVHERVHAQRRDFLWRALCPVIAVGHLPVTTEALRLRLAATQELLADAAAAAMIDDGRLKLAEALLTLARSSRPPAPGIAFTDGDLTARIHALLEGQLPVSAWPARILLVIAVLLPVAVGLAHDPIHHSLETLLGAFS